MIRSLTLLLCLLTGCIALAQDIDFQLDENGLIIYSEVVNAEGLTADQLLDNALNFFEQKSQDKKKGEKRYEKIDTTAPSLTYAGSFILYKKSLGKVPEGSVSYHITFEAKDNRYRYIVQQFHFIPYERNRYGRFVPVKGQPSTLEKYLPQKNKAWAKNFESIHAKVEYMAQKLKDKALEIPVAPQEKEIVKLSNDW